MSEPALKTSTCVDCGITILGERLRCPRCHAVHSDRISKVEVELAVPFETPRSATRILLAWFLALQVVGAILLGVVVVARGCR